MDNHTRQREAELHARVRELERELQRIPSRTPPSTVQTNRRILIGTSNNKLLGFPAIGGLRGAKYNATPISVSNPLTTAYDPSAPVAITDDGIAYGTDDLGVACLIFNSPFTDGGVITYGGGILSHDLPQTCSFLAWRQMALPVSGGATVTAWEAYWA